MPPCTSFRRILEPVAESWAYHVTTFRHGLRTILACRRPLDSHADPIQVRYGPRRSVGFNRPITCPVWPCTTDRTDFPKPVQNPHSMYWYENLIQNWKGKLTGSCDPSAENRKNTQKTRRMHVTAASHEGDFFRTSHGQQARMVPNSFGPGTPHRSLVTSTEVFIS